MNYKSYGTRKTVPSRMGRKRARREVFVLNKKASKTRRKVARLARQQEIGE